MRTLKPNIINRMISHEIIKNTKNSVEFNHEVNKNYTHEEFYHFAVIPVSSIENAHCHLQLFDSDTGEFFLKEEDFKLSFLPGTLMNGIKKKRHQYVHVLVKTIIFYHKEERVMIVPIGAERFGYSSNDAIIHPEGRWMLGNFFKAYLEDKESCWKNIPLPRYGEMRGLKQNRPKALLQALIGKLSIAKRSIAEDQKIA